MRFPKSLKIRQASLKRHYQPKQQIHKSQAEMGNTAQQHESEAKF